MESTEESTEASIAPAAVSPNVEERESHFRSSPHTSESTPDEIGGVGIIPQTDVDPVASKEIVYNRPRANASAGRHGSPIPFKLVDIGPSPAFKASLGPTMRAARDAHQVIMGENPNFPPRSSSLPVLPPPTTSQPTSTENLNIVSRLSRPTVSSSARAVVATTAASNNGRTGAVKTPNAARSASDVVPSVIRDANVSQTPSARCGRISQASCDARHGIAPQTSSAKMTARAIRTPTATLATNIAGSASGIQSRSAPRAGTPSSARSAKPTTAPTAARLTGAINYTPTAKAASTTNPTSAIRFVKRTKPASATRSAKARKHPTVAAKPSVGGVASARGTLRAKPPPSAINSLKSASKGFKSRISAMIANRHPTTDLHQHEYEQQPEPLVVKYGEAQGSAEAADANLAASLPSSPPHSDILGDDIDNFLSMSRDQLDRLIQFAQGMEGEKREGAMKAIDAFGNALVAVTAARKANMDLSAAIVSLSRQATDLGNQALAVIQG